MKDLTEEEQFCQLENAINLRHHEHDTWLNITFTSFTTNAILFVALFATDKRQFWEAEMIAFFGVMVSFASRFLQKAAYDTMRSHEEYSKEIEKSLSSKYNDYSGYNDAREKYMKILGTSGSEPENPNKDLSYKKTYKGLARGIMNTQHIFLILLWYFVTLIYFLIFCTYESHFDCEKCTQSVIGTTAFWVNAGSFLLFTFVLIWVMRIMNLRPWWRELKYAYNSQKRNDVKNYEEKTVDSQ